MLIKESKIRTTQDIFRNFYLNEICTKNLIFRAISCLKKSKTVFKYSFRSFSKNHINFFKVFKIGKKKQIKKEIIRFFKIIYFEKFKITNYFYLSEICNENFEFRSQNFPVIHTFMTFLKKYTCNLTLKITSIGFLKFKDFLVSLFWCKKIKLLLKKSI